MTREAAIKILMDGELNPCVAEDREACDMAIKALEQEPTTKNDLGVDCISREQAKEAIRDKFKDLSSRVEINTILNDLPSVTPQEPFKPMVEIDLYSVIKQKYIEREVLDKIRAEIDNTLSDGMIHKKTVLGIIDKYKAETEE